MGKVLMPGELTAENGAKSLLLGNYHELVRIDCPDCWGDGCWECDRQGYQVLKVGVSWSNIKEIYKAAVAHLGQSAE